MKSKALPVLVAALALGAVACETDGAPRQALVELPDVRAVDTATVASTPVAPDVTIRRAVPIAPAPVRVLPAPPLPSPAVHQGHGVSQPPRAPLAPASTQAPAAEPSTGTGGVTGLVQRVAPLP